jgi:ADP-heptose:LPS heptosyltransferase
VLAAVQRAYPEAKLNILANRQVAALALDAVKVSELKFLDDAEFAPFFSGGSRVRAGDYFHPDDLVISYLHDPSKVFETNVRGCGLKHFYVGPSKIAGATHAAEQLAEPLRVVHVPITDFAPRLNISQESRREAQRKLGTPAAIVVHPGSGSRRKNWPIVKWVHLISDLLSRGIRIVVVGGEADHDQIAHLGNQFGTDLSFAVDWPVRNLAALLANRVFIGHDSGISHLAAATGAPSIILFGPTDPKIWAPRNVNARILVAPQADLDQLSVAAARDSLYQELMRIGIKT